MKNSGSKKTGKDFDKSKASSYSGKKRSRFKTDDSSSIDVKRGGRLSRTNDWRWYATNEQLLKDVASYPYDVPLGTRLRLGANATAANKSSVPGVMAIYTSPAFGISTHINSPINVAARAVYTWVRHANSGHSNYDSPDLMLYLMAMDSCYSYLSYLKRMYGVMQTYSQTNRYYPQAIIRAMNASWDSLAANLADFRAFINFYAVKLSKLVIPANMSYMAKHQWMYEGMYTDSQQDKAQTYLFSPRGFYKFTLDESSAGMLEYKELGTVPVIAGMIPELTITQLIQFGNSLLDPILANEDFNIMSGDILKAYGANVVKVEGISETYTVLPVYDETVLDQIQNLTLIGDYGTTEYQNAMSYSEPNLTQNATKTHLLFNPRFFRYTPFTGKDATTSMQYSTPPGRVFYEADKIISFEHGAVTPQNTIEATRMALIADPASYVWDYTDQIDSHLISSCGSEVAHHAVIFTWEENASGDWGIQPARVHGSTVATISFDVNGGLGMYSVGALMLSSFDSLKNIMTKLSMFNRHMSVSFTAGLYQYSLTASERKNTYSPFVGGLMDINYYTVVTATNLSNMNECALISMFDVSNR